MDKLLSPKSVAQLLDCSISMVYKMRASGELPMPDVKLFGESERGFRWRESTIQSYIQKQSVAVIEDNDDAPPFVPLVIGRHTESMRKTG